LIELTAKLLDAHGTARRPDVFWSYDAELHNLNARIDGDHAAMAISDHVKALVENLPSYARQTRRPGRLINNHLHNEPGLLY
jgi:hypothetical protein